jgi:hypothetical protein
MKILAISAVIAVTLILAGCGQEKESSSTIQHPIKRAHNNAQSFVPDAGAQKDAETNSLDACAFVSEHFGVKLDWSDASIQQVESVLDAFHAGIASANPSQKQIWWYSKLFGSYIGEVYRKNHGATWGIVQTNGWNMPALKADLNGQVFLPLVRTRDRIVDGAANNVGEYYSQLPHKPDATPAFN